MKRSAAIVISVATFPATILTALLLGLYFKSTNPNNIDFTQSLAYLSQSLVPAIIIFVSILLITAILIFFVYRQDGYKSARLPLLLLAINVSSVMLILALNWQINNVQDQYLIDHNRPTFQQYLENLDRQK